VIDMHALPITDPVSSPRRRRQLRAVVVDDDPGNRMLVCLRLRDAGFATWSFASGAQALAGVERLAPVVVVTDLQMPGLSGLDIVGALRRGARPPYLVVTSARSDPDVAASALAAGADAFVAKSAEQEAWNRHLDVARHRAFRDDT
jgi:CheY-like chemotaxis protein